MTLRYAPDFKIEINGEPIPAVLRASISSVNYHTGLEGSDRVELTLVNENLRWLDHPLLKLDNKLSMSIGYVDGGLERVFVGEVVGQTPSFPSGGTATLIVVAQDRLHRLQQGTHTRWFHLPVPGVNNVPIPDPIIASAISAGNGLIPVMDPVAAALSILLGYAETASVLLGQTVIRRQSGESNADFLQRIAQGNGWEMLIDHSGPLGGYKLRFMSPAKEIKPVVTMEYGKSLVDFTGRVTNVGQVLAVRVRVWVPDIKTEFTVTVGWDWDRQALDISIRPGLGLPSTLTTTPEALEEDLGAEAAAAARAQVAQEAVESNLIDLINKPVSLLSAPRKIVGELLPRLNNRLTGQGSTIGDPRIRAGIVLRMEGLGQQFGGYHRVTSATHTIDSGGYRTSFETRKEIWFGSIPPVEQGSVPIRLQGQSVPIPLPGR